MIDAGTGGTRIYPFYWQTITRNNLYVQVNPVLKKTLKSPNEVAAYLQPLIDKAKEFIPQDQHANTPILFKATAGMRLLPVSRRNEVMRAVIAFLNDRSQVPFRFNAANGAQIISGEQEGVYGWVTTNAMMGTLRGSNTQQVTFANIDLGRGSTQITFKPPVVPLENAYITRVNGTEYELYSHSYLRMGLEEARSRVIASLAGNNNNKVDDPCLFRGTVQNYSLNDRTVQLVGQGQFDKCRDLARQVLLGRNTFCATEPCAINGVHQP
ncbi:nucleoside phosphatase GDA1/CD39, partial [Syncephalis plumigaleata]